MTRAEFFRDRCAWIRPGARVPYELACGVIAEGDRWRRADGAVVDSPGMARRVVRGPHGWQVTYGANTLVIDGVVEAGGRRIWGAYARLIEGRPVGLDAIQSEIAAAFEDSVFHQTTGRYASFRRRGDDLVFGVHFIDTAAAARYLIRESGLVLAMEPDTRRRARGLAKGDEARDGSAG